MLKLVIRSVVFGLVAGLAGTYLYIRNTTCKVSEAEFVKAAEVYYNKCRFNHMDEKNEELICEAMTMLYIIELDGEYKQRESECLKRKEVLGL